VVGSSNSSEDGSLLLVICKTLAGVVSASTLRDLKDDGSFDVSAELRSENFGKVYDSPADLAASKTALAVDEEVTF